MPKPYSMDLRERVGLTVRALDGRLAGESYRVIAAGLFGDARVPKTHDLRDRTIRLVPAGIELMQGGHLDLLRIETRTPGVARTPPPGLPHPPPRRCSAIVASDLPPLSGGRLQDHGVRSCPTRW